MADPFSIIAGTIGVAEVLFRLGRYLKEVYDDAEVIDDYILGLQNEAAELRTIVFSIHETFKAPKNANLTASDPDSVTVLWEQLGRSLHSCLRGVQEMEIIVRDICGKGGQASMLDNLVKAHRKRTKAHSLRKCRDQLATYQRSLQIVLATIILYSILPIVAAISDISPESLAIPRARQIRNLLRSSRRKYRTPIARFIPILRRYEKVIRWMRWRAMKLRLIQLLCLHTRN
jgi:hypothetical protein